MAGVEPIKEYIVNNKIDLDSDTLGVDLVEYIINRRLLVATDFDEKLHQYYRGDDSDPEVRIVRFVQQTIKEVKIAEKYFAGNPGDLLFDVSQEIVKLAGETGQRRANMSENKVELRDIYDYAILQGSVEGAEIIKRCGA